MGRARLQELNLFGVGGLSLRHHHHVLVQAADLGHVGVLHAFLLLEALKGRRDPFGQAEITQSYILVVVEKDIFWCNVAMDYLSLMQIVDSFQDLPVNFPLEFLICASWVLPQEVIQRLTVAVLHLNVEYLDPFGLARAVNVLALALGAAVITSLLGIVSIRFYLFGREATFVEI